MLSFKKTLVAVLFLSGSQVFSGNIATACTSENVTVLCQKTVCSMDSCAYYLTMHSAGYFAYKATVNNDNETTYENFSEKKQIPFYNES